MFTCILAKELNVISTINFVDKLYGPGNTVGCAVKYFDFNLTQKLKARETASLSNHIFKPSLSRSKDLF